MKGWLELLWLRFQNWRLRKEPVNPTYTGRAVILTYDPNSRRLEDAREVSYQERQPE